MSEMAPQKSRSRRPPATAWAPGQSGNPAGRPRGTRNRATLLAEALLDGEVDAIVRRVIDGALAGDPVCLRLALERLVPPAKDRPIQLELPRLASAADAVTAVAAVTASVADGAITPAEGVALAGLVEIHRKTLETAALVARIEALERNQR